MRLAPQAKYLGIVHGPGRLFIKCTDELLAAGRKAMYATIRDLRVQKLHTPSVMMDCFNTYVRPVLSYSCQVWGPDMVHRYGLDFYTAIKDPMVQLQIDFMRMVVGAKLPPHALLFMELGQVPMQCHWAQLAFTFWNSIITSRK